MIITDIEVLRKPSEQASADEADGIIRLLEDELRASPRGGIGLAAPQIGVRKQVAIIRTENHSVDLVNPVIADRGQAFVFRNEGCLSLPGVSVDTWRFGEVFVKCDRNPAGIVATGLEAVAIQHEIDHLAGILMVDRVGGKNTGRNDPCPCGSKIKFKRCHGRI